MFLVRKKSYIFRSMLRVQPQPSHFEKLSKACILLPPSTLNEAVSSCIVGAARRHHKFNPKKGAVAKMKGSAAAAMGWLGRKLFGNNGEDDDSAADKNAGGSESGETAARGGWDARRASIASVTSTGGSRGNDSNGSAMEGLDSGDCRDWSRPRVYNPSVPPELPRDFERSTGSRYTRYLRPRVRAVPAGGPQETSPGNKEGKPGASAGRSGQETGKGPRTSQGQGRGEVSRENEGAAAVEEGERDEAVDAVDYPDLRLSRYALAPQCDDTNDEDKHLLRFDFSTMEPLSATPASSLAAGSAGPGTEAEAASVLSAGVGIALTLSSASAGGEVDGPHGHSGPRQRKRTLSQDEPSRAAAQKAVALAASLRRPPRSTSSSSVSPPTAKSTGDELLSLSLSPGGTGKPPSASLGRAKVLPSWSAAAAGAAPRFDQVVPAVPCVAMASRPVPAGHWVTVRLRVRNSGAAHAAARCRRLADLAVPD